MDLERGQELFGINMNQFELMVLPGEIAGMFCGLLW